MASVEVGQSLALQKGLALTPQAQLSWADVGMDSFTEPGGATVDVGDTDSLRMRLGLAAARSWATDAGTAATVYGIANVTRELHGDSQVLVDTTALDAAAPDWTAEVGLGGSYDWQAGASRPSEGDQVAQQETSGQLRRLLMQTQRAPRNNEVSSIELLHFMELQNMTKGRPHAHTRLTQFVTKRVLELRPKKSQQDIAAEAGFTHPNMISLIKSGATKVPLDRVPALARALETDPKLLFRLALEQAGGETTRMAVEDIFGTIVSRNEVVWLEEVRDASGNTDPALTSRARSAIRGIFGK